MKFFAWVAGVGMIALLASVVLWKAAQFGAYYFLFGGWRHK